jgi:hypothetical protein
VVDEDLYGFCDDPNAGDERFFVLPEQTHTSVAKPRLDSDRGIAIVMEALR